MSTNTTGAAAEPKFKYYSYDPSLAGNTIFAVVFALSTIGHAFMLFKHKTWYFLAFLIGCLFETIGFIGRVVSATETPDWKLSTYIMQTLLILLAPALYAASVYMVLGRLIRLLDAHEYSVVRTSWLTKIFVLGDVLSFLAQSGGGGILASAKTPENQKLGGNVILGGLGIQVVFFGLFIVVIIIFHVRMRKNPTPRSYSITASWEQFIYVLYASSALILIRSVFRMVEYGAGHDSALMKNEVYLLVLDSLLMFQVSALFLWKHPGGILAGYKEVNRNGDAESRGGDRYPMVPVEYGSGGAGAGGGEGGLGSQKMYDGEDTSTVSEVGGGGNGVASQAKYARRQQRMSYEQTAATTYSTPVRKQ
ncbi:RTA1 like protein-domain-containing protein [Bombardia bombarda]|uniref:RTA1 like protein-domain-containing protein n=1 Tax=Bombardia bombarda TaxID=252184 RepID=A0AA39WH71_9PEZI|nr:RTA1 like protein-domain-containing protein [Bombardia bombarda]